MAAAPAHPLLVGNRDMLRKLRAAEMAAWEATLPNTPGEQTPVLEEDSEPTAPDKSLNVKFWTLLLLLVCGTVLVSLDLQDFSLLQAGWSQLLAGFRSLFT